MVLPVPLAFAASLDRPRDMPVPFYPLAVSAIHLPDALTPRQAFGASLRLPGRSRTPLGRAVRRRLGQGPPDTFGVVVGRVDRRAGLLPP
jgi:hypothetical protein